MEWATFTAAAWTLATLWAGHGQRTIRFLREQPPRQNGPKVSFVIAARNEERGIEKALRSVLAQDYTDYEVIVVNDRSTDRTAEAISRISAHPRLRFVSITTLPDGWIGKNYALWTGAKQASGDILVFADADIEMEPTSLSRAVVILNDEKLDHFAVAPEVTGAGFWLKTLISGFTLNFAFYAMPWKARDPKSRKFIGIGAFNMVRAAAYRAIGTHEAFRFSPIDDMVLGQRLKKAGFRQDMRWGLGLLRVEWYPSVGELARGLEKNAFAGAYYSVSLVIAGTIAIALFQLWPFVALFITPHPEKWLYGIAAFAMIILAMDNTRYQGHSRFLGFFLPFSSLFGVYAVWRSALKALWNDGVDWRGTHYALKDLRKSLLCLVLLASAVYGQSPQEYRQLYDTCKTKPDAMDCDRYIENQRILQFGKRVQRTLEKLVFYNQRGKQIASLVDELAAGENSVRYSLLTFLKPLNCWLVSVSFYEGGMFYLIDANTGKKTDLHGRPMISPDQKRFVTASASGEAGDSPNEIAVFKVKTTGPEIEWRRSPPQEQGPRDPEWKSSSEIHFSFCDLDGKCLPKRLILSNDTWLVI